jgi:rhodanese-related sulfurtransferase
VALPFEIAPSELKKRLDSGEKIHLVDVRESIEYQIAHVANSELIPMASVPGALQKIERMTDDGTVVVLCHHGIRSLAVVNWLRQAGVEECQSLAGGIDRWSAEIDRAIPRY